MTRSRLPDPERIEREFSELYTELKLLAGQVWRSNPSATLTRTALLNEAYLRLARSQSAAVVDRAHFKRLAASAMRKILIDAARRRESLKRGAGWVQVTAEQVVDHNATDLDQLLQLNEAIDRLASIAPRQAELVVLRFFGGLEAREAATELGISDSAGARDWRAARAWLAVELGESGAERLDPDAESEA